ncbi:MAG: hypothetical protein FJZ01_09340 [Candidatus Sericytochromatia bacterium]|nr:hypothetical protein [Candidatus Tanganyikabacteria bacterium]
MERRGLTLGAVLAGSWLLLAGCGISQPLASLGDRAIAQAGQEEEEEEDAKPPAGGTQKPPAGDAAEEEDEAKPPAPGTAPPPVAPGTGGGGVTVGPLRPPMGPIRVGGACRKLGAALATPLDPRGRQHITGAMRLLGCPLVAGSPLLLRPGLPGMPLGGRLRGGTRDHRRR